MPKDQQKHSSTKKRSGERRRKKNLERKQGAQAIQKKEMQQRTQSPEAETTYLSSNVVKVTPSQRAKWQPLPKSTREHLESMMHWLIISLLYEATRNRNEIEKHLNILKKRLMKHFETLRVPMEKLSRLKNVHKMLAEEKKKSVSLEDGLAELQDEIDKVLPAAELRDENIHSLQNKVQELKRELAAEEAAASELFQTDGNDGLALPDISQYQLKAPILQDELLKTGNQEGLLNDLNTIQESEEMKTMLAFLEQAYENVDF